MMINMLSLYLVALLFYGTLSQELNCRFKPECEVKCPIITCEAKNISSGGGEDLNVENDDIRQKIKEIKQVNNDLLKEVIELRTESKELREETGKLRKETNELRKKAKHLQRKLGDARTESVTMKNDIVNIYNELKDLSLTIPTHTFADRCTVMYNSKCFGVVLTHRFHIVHINDVQEICNHLGMELANIYDVAHYHLLADEVRKKIFPKETWISLWTGMTYKNNKLHLRSGDQVTMEDIWFPEYPMSHASYTNIGVLVDKDKESKYQGIVNNWPSLRLRGAICEL